MNLSNVEISSSNSVSSTSSERKSTNQGKIDEVKGTSPLTDLDNQNNNGSTNSTEALSPKGGRRPVPVAEIDSSSGKKILPSSKNYSEEKNHSTMIAIQNWMTKSVQLMKIQSRSL